jgi:hypothetical protein
MHLPLHAQQKAQQKAQQDGTRHGPGRIRIRRIVVLGAGLVLVAGGAAVGATTGNPFTDSTGAYHGCVTNNGTLRVLVAGEDCKKNETAISWNQAGQPGAEGQKGDPGQKGDAGQKGDPGPATPPRSFTAGQDTPPGGQGVGGFPQVSITLPHGWWSLTATIDLVAAAGTPSTDDADCRVGVGQYHVVRPSASSTPMTVTDVFHVAGDEDVANLSCFSTDRQMRAFRGQITAVEVSAPTTQPAN